MHPSPGSYLGYYGLPQYPRCCLLLVDRDDADPVGAVCFTPHVIARVGDPIALNVAASKLHAAQGVTLLDRSTGPTAGNLPPLVSEVGHSRSSPLTC